MGDPLHMSGQQGKQSEKVREFAGRLGEKTGLSIEFWDETAHLKGSGTDTDGRAESA